MTSNYISKCQECDAVIDLNSIANLQKKIGKTMASQVNTKYSSEVNDLSLKVNEESVLKLSWYNSILENIAHCNPCFKEYYIEDLVDLVDSEITNSKS